MNKLKNVDSVSKITSILEDISISPVENKDENEFKLQSSSSNNKTLSQIDSETIKLIELINEYELHLSENNLNYANGFLTLSRANYNSGLIKKFGHNSFDFRPYDACKKINIVNNDNNNNKNNDIGNNGDNNDNEYDTNNNELKLIDDLKLQKLNKTKQQVQDKENGKNQLHKDTSLTEKSKTTSKNINKSDSILKNRNRIKSYDNEKINEITELDIQKVSNLKDPINQFGGLVPYQLRQSQSFFNDSLQGSIETVNLRNKIHKLINKIELLKQTSSDQNSLMQKEKEKIVSE